MANTIKIKRGLSSNIPNVTLEQGELAITTDTNELYIGTESGNTKLNESSLKNIVDGSSNGSIRTINSTVENSTYTLGKNAFSEGSKTKASGQASHSEGWLTIASGNYAHAEGESATASGDDSHAEGGNTTSSGHYSHAEGYGTKASGSSSHAEGGSTIASEWASHTEGANTIAQGEVQHVQGKWNIADTTSAHILGNGTEGTDADGDANRSNAHTIDWHGNAWFAGDVYTGSTSGKNKDSGSKKLATEEYVNSKSSITTVKSSETDANIITLIKNTVQSTGEPKSNLIYLDTTANKIYTLSTCSFKDSTYSLIFTDDSKYVSITFTSDATTITKEEGNLIASADDILGLFA